MRITVFLGAPGSGKGTQAKRLAETGQFQHFSTGDMLRGAITRKEPVGISANQFISKGELVPDGVMIELISEALVKVNSKSQVLLDGFPRTIPQSTALDSKPETRVKSAIFFDLPEKVLIERLTGRRICKNCGEPFHVVFVSPKKEGVCDKCGGELLQRADDQISVVKKRLEVFTGQNEKLLNYYDSAKRLTRLDGNQAVDRIQDQLRRLLQ
ncbi:MAG: nucleoside monophosphate kinase [Deltaproteobacteria bacterium]|nr:nucleoside monophosphate kinase [Deltaproteobacteria bacterium]MBI3293543.1 nucleoside monophosphate kinase [Deltaproteobacteria bacterium]